MHVGIDASNLRFGGGVTHLVQLLGSADPARDGFERVDVWTLSATAARLAGRPWLRVHTPPALDGSLLHRLAWQRARLDAELEAAGVDVLLVPGGAYGGAFRPFVAMCRNMVPFDRAAMRRFGLSRRRLYWHLLRKRQGDTFRRADGVVFLSETARRAVTGAVGPLAGRQALIPHGIADRFFCPPRAQLPPGRFGPERPFRWLYVSTVDGYKHQPETVRAALLLRERGRDVRLDLVGRPWPPWGARLLRLLAEVDPEGRTVTFHGGAAFGDLHRVYQRADAFLFASSCENLPNTLLEAMAAGLPIACSDRSVMPEVLGEGGRYFDPEDPVGMADAMEGLMADSGLRERVAAEAHRRARAYSWNLAARRTFRFLREVAAPAPADAACSA